MTWMRLFPWDLINSLNRVFKIQFYYLNFNLTISRATQNKNPKSTIAHDYWSLYGKGLFFQVKTQLFRSRVGDIWDGMGSSLNCFWLARIGRHTFGPSHTSSGLGPTIENSDQAWNSWARPINIPRIDKSTGSVQQFRLCSWMIMISCPAHVITRCTLLWDGAGVIWKTWVALPMWSI